MIISELKLTITIWIIHQNKSKDFEKNSLLKLVS